MIDKKNTEETKDNMVIKKEIDITKKNLIKIGINNQIFLDLIIIILKKK
jgi:hypothetical protein